MTATTNTIHDPVAPNSLRFSTYNTCMTPIPNKRRAKVKLMPMLTYSRGAPLFCPAVVETADPVMVVTGVADKEVVPAELVPVGVEVAAGPETCA